MHRKPSPQLRRAIEDSGIATVVTTPSSRAAGDVDEEQALAEALQKALQG